MTSSSGLHSGLLEGSKQDFLQYISWYLTCTGDQLELEGTMTSCILVRSITFLCEVVNDVGEMCDSLFETRMR